MEQAVTLMTDWARPHVAAFAGATMEVVRLPGRTPLIFIEVPGDDNDDTVLLYGHLDKQPEMKGWAEGMGPWIPVRKDDKLYGRGGADDGYAIYACFAALLALQEQKRAARPLRHHDRGLRGIRQLRPALLCRPSARPDRRSVAGRLPRFGLRRLGPDVAHHVVARHRGRHAEGARAERGRALGRRVGDRALLVPHHARAADAAGGRGDRRDEAAGALRADPAAAHRAGLGGRARAGRRGLSQVPVRRHDQADGRRSRPDGAEPHLAAAARDGRHGGLSRAGRRRQRAAALHRGQDQRAHAADARRQGGREGDEEGAGSPIRPTAPPSSSTPAKAARAAGTRRRWRRGWRRP